MDAELVTLAVLQALLGYSSEARWLRYRTQLPPGPSAHPCTKPRSGSRSCWATTARTFRLATTHGSADWAARTHNVELA